ncbi:MAG: aspartate aminotransferase family protein [Bacteroidetes bacterium]|nr:MAG: aspartate aminotransferase family protein [Bacteroidota bacterium]
MTNRQAFLQHVAQTSPMPIGLEIVSAEGCYLYDAEGKAYLDLISGFSVMNIGHGNPRVKAAIHAQVEQYMHLMVYGELIERPQVQYAQLLARHLPATLDCVYFTNSGSEATEGAMKLAKRATGRTEILAFKKAYHGSTQGALSLMGSEYWRNAYRPLLPHVGHLDFNSDAAIAAVTTETACVVVEVVQAEAGVHAALHNWLKALRQKCTDVGALLVFDEIQTGFGRTGTLWAFEAYGIVPDVLLLGKALGGGLPLGAFVASHGLMQLLTHSPVLGHISTFAGHPVCCAAGMAAFGELLTALRHEPIDDDAASAATAGEQGPVNAPYWPVVTEKEQLVRSLLVHPAIKSVRSRGLLMAVEFENAAICQQICHYCVQHGAITDWFLFAPQCLRIAPPITVTPQQLLAACALVLEACTVVVPAV